MSVKLHTPDSWQKMRSWRLKANNSSHAVGLSKLAFPNSKGKMYVILNFGTVKKLMQPIQLCCGFSTQLPLVKHMFMLACLLHDCLHFMKTMNKHWISALKCLHHPTRNPEEKVTYAVNLDASNYEDTLKTPLIIID